MHSTIFTLLLAPAPRETQAKSCAPRGAVQPSQLGLAETWMWPSLLLASSENPSKLFLFSHPALVIASLLHKWLWELQVCKGGMRWAARRHRSRTKQLPAQGAAWNWNHARTHHLKAIPFSLINTSQKKGLWLCSTFILDGGWGGENTVLMKEREQKI